MTGVPLQHFKFFPALIFLGLISPFTHAQCDLTPDSTGKFVFTGTESVNMRSAKKMKEAVLEWTSGRIEYPPLVFSVFPENKEEKNVIVMRVVTQIPSVTTLNDFSFLLRIECGKRQYRYRIDQCLFEDIQLSLEEWYRKNKTRDDERGLKNSSIVCRSISSHIGLMLTNLNEKLNQK